LPDTIQFVAGHQNYYTYDASGKKLEVQNITSRNILNLPQDTITRLTSSTKLTTDYCGDAIYQNDTLKEVLTPEGYWQNGLYYYYLKDHQGSTREVLRQDNTVMEYSDYYPDGMRFESSTSNSAALPYRYNGKELEAMNGLNEYDYGARRRETGIPVWTTMDPLAEKYYEMSPYVYCKNSPILQIDPLGMESGKATYDPNSDTYNASLNEVTVTAPALYKESITYQVFGELAYGNLRYTSEHLNPYIFTNRGINKGLSAELQVGLIFAGGVGTAVRIGTIGYRTLKGLDLAIMAGKALGDAIGQFGGNLLKGQAATQALANINLVSVGLSGLGVNPLSASALSNEFNIRASGFSLENNSENYLWNTAWGTVFGLGANGVNNLNQYKSLTIGVQMRTALSTSPSIGGAAANVMIAAPSSASTLGGTLISK
jgi:RHS repeat-associated protein